MERLALLASHVTEAAASGEPRRTGRHPTDARFVDLPIYRWEEVMEHNSGEDLWVVIDGKVFDMTEFVNSGIHPGGDEIPTEFAGKDASEYWNEIHAHIKEDILEDLVEGEGAMTGLEELPVLVGIIDAMDPMPAEAGSAYGDERYWSRNWAGNVSWAHGGNFAEPESVEELRALVAGASKLRCLGRGHGFPAVCDSEDLMVSLRRMNKVLELDLERQTVTVEGGMNYSQLVAYLAQEDCGLALQNVACLSVISLVGGSGTGTHGSSGVGSDGRAYTGNLASQLRAMEFVTADGSLVSYKEGDEDWDGCRVHVGCLGPVTRLTIQLVPDYDTQVTVYHGISTLHFIKHFREMLASCDSFSLYHQFDHDDWKQQTGSLWLRVKVPVGSEWPAAPPTWFGQGELYDRQKHGPSRMANRVSRNVGGLWAEGLAPVEGKEVNGILDELQYEYFTPLEHAEAALAAGWEAGSSLYRQEMDPEENPRGRVGHYTEIRCVRGDDGWISPTRTADGGDVVVFHVGSTVQDLEASSVAADAVEAALAPFDARAHWGKMTNLSKERISELYGEHLTKFQALASRHDADGKFRNRWAEEHLF
jgi:xylitol oxidase